METRPKTLPIHKIKGTFFNVDIDKRLFIKTGVPGHVFSFDDMVYKDNHYEMKYDLYHQSPAKDGISDPQDVVSVKIPQLKDLALAEMSEKYQIPAYEMKNKTDFEVMVDLKALGEREKGVLPTYEILDQKYTVDLDSYCFRMGNHTIPLKGFKPLAGSYGDRYAYIDSTTHQLVNIEVASIKEMPPEHVVKIVIPSNDRLDPYYVGKNREPDLKTYLLANPIVSGQKAKIIPLSQTNIPQIVKSNVNRELREQFEQTQKSNKRQLRRGVS